uniref:Uncharacterized protein n=1 Tax=Tanacetum cinerariifolium TaxID=118510 RepID=A0A6L2NFI2_TANCI|nr:hypothetical protein [Tanacetum cinerariifolium]
MDLPKPLLLQSFPFSNRNGNSLKPVAQTITNDAGTSTTLIPGPVTTKEKAQKINDVKARSMLLMVLPNEHLMTFNQYKDAKTVFAAIQTRFGGNEATKKTQKTLLKQMHEKFSATSTESLDSIFNRLQKIWNTHVVVWRNKPNLDTMSIDDLYNNFNIADQEVKGTVSSNSSSQNMAFVSYPSTNEVYTAYGVSTSSTQSSTTSTQVGTASTQTSTAYLSDATVYAFVANQLNGSQLVHEDLEQIHEDDLEEMDLKWQLALLSMRAKRFFQKTRKKININRSDTAGFDKSKVECYNCHKIGDFVRECRGPKNQDSRNRYQDSSRRIVHVEETSPKAMVAIDGPEFESYRPKTSKNANKDIPNKLKEYLDALLVKDRVLDNKDCSIESPIVVEKKIIVPTIAKVEVVRPKQQEKLVRKIVGYAKMYRPRVVNTARPRAANTGRPNSAVVNAVRANPVQEDQRYVDSGFSRNMTENMSYLSKFKEFDEGYVTFGGGANGGRITDKLTTAIDVNAVEDTSPVDKKKVIITEISVRSDLHLKDVKGTECLPTATIFEHLTLMGVKTTAWNEFSNTIASAIMYLSTNQKFTFSRYIFDHMVKNLEGGVKFLMFPRFVQVFLDSQFKEMLKHKKIYVTPYYTKKIFANMKRLGKDFSDEHVTTTSNDPLRSDEASFCDQEDASKQERIINNLDADEGVTLVDETQWRNDQGMFDTSILDDEEVVTKKVVSTANPITTTGEVVTTIGVETSKPKAKGIVMQEPSETPTPTPVDYSQQPSKAKDKDTDHELAARLKEEERGDMTIEEKSSKKAEEGSSKRAGGKLEQEDAKRQRIKEENEYVELKICLEIIPDDEDDVTIEATPLSSKSSTIVDYKIYKEGRKSFFKIIRADGNS